MRSARTSERGAATFALLVVVLICGALAAAVLLPGIARQRTAAASLARENAFQLAESGLDWGIAAVRRSNGAIPPTGDETLTVGTLGSFAVHYESGVANSIDDDGDGTVDESDESDFMLLQSTGVADAQRRTLQVVLRRSVQVPQVEAAVQFNVSAPIVDLKGDAFLISGEDHDLDGNVDALAPQKAGIASPADVGVVVSQIAPARYDQVVGAGGMPSVGQVGAMDLATIVAQARSGATVQVEPGTHTNLALGTATAGGVVVAYCDGDLHLSGNNEGAGVLIVDGDLDISGSFLWTGIIIVRGRATLVGGGGGKRLIGGLIIGEEITSDVDTTEVTVTGTVDLFYSSQAIALASQSLYVMSVLSWQEIANP